MAEQLYFVRVRGRVAGPYSTAQLKAMHVRGQFARFSEVSVDQVHWVAAAEVQALFPGAFAGPPPEWVPPAATQVEPAADARQWYYLDDDEAKKGPLSLGELQQLLDAGEV